MSAIDLTKLLEIIAAFNPQTARALVTSLIEAQEALKYYANDEHQKVIGEGYQDGVGGSLARQALEKIKKNLGES